MRRIKCGGGMAATPSGAHQVGAHTADRMASRYASGHDVVGRVGVVADVASSAAPARPCSVSHRLPPPNFEHLFYVPKNNGHS